MNDNLNWYLIFFGEEYPPSIKDMVSWLLEKENINEVIEEFKKLYNINNVTIHQIYNCGKEKPVYIESPDNLWRKTLRK
jgi:hypothetical protein